MQTMFVALSDQIQHAVAFHYADSLIRIHSLKCLIIYSDLSHSFPMKLIKTDEKESVQRSRKYLSLSCIDVYINRLYRGNNFLFISPQITCVSNT